MSNQDNPYINFIEIVKKMNNEQPSFKLGNVISVDPFLVNVEGIQLDKDDLLINDSLTDFNKGDTVVMLTDIKKNQFILICKVG